MACFLLNDALCCENPCAECVMQKEGDFDGMFWRRELNENVSEYCCQVCRRLKKTNSMNVVIKDDCYDCDLPV